MEKLINKIILMIMAACISLSAGAYGDDGKKSKKIPIHSIENKKAIKIGKTEKEDTLVYDKKAVDDTLTFDDKKAVDDTLIFADDEIMYQNKNNKKDFSIVSKEKSTAINAVIFPNPSFGQSTIEMNTSDGTITEISVMSQDGTLIKKETVSGKNYELNDLAAGTYIVTMRSGGQLIQKRLLVK